MPVEFLTDEEAGAYGRFAGGLPRAELDRFCLLDDEDLRLVSRSMSEFGRAWRN